MTTFFWTAGLVLVLWVIFVRPDQLDE